MNTLTIKEEYRIYMIPSIENMIQKERDHYYYLCKFNETNYPMITIFKEKSKLWQQHLTERLAEYIQHYENLP